VISLVLTKHPSRSSPEVREAISKVYDGSPYDGSVRTEITHNGELGHPDADGLWEAYREATS
jgi:hypothetical protein